MIHGKNLLIRIFKWILVILFFPLSLIFVAYFNRKRNPYKYEWEDHNEVLDTDSK